MRPALNNIEKAVQFLNGELSAADQLTYAESIKQDTEIAQLTEEVKLLETAIKRKALRAQIESHSSGGAGKLPWIVGGLVLLLAGIFAWMQLTSFHESDNQAAPMLESVEADHVQEESASATTAIYETEEDKPITLGGQELWVMPDVQSFHFDSREGATITGKQGTLIIVPTNAFTDKKGKLLTGAVEFRLVEALNLEDMVLYKLQTVSDAGPLESGGMFYIEATVGGRQAEINPDRPLYIEIPTPVEKEGMMGFKGEVVDGKINWTDPKPLQKYLVHIPLDSLDFLPQGFASEVENHMPFKSYDRTTPELVDSLYYSLPDVGAVSSTYPQSETTDYLDEADTAAACGIHPHTIETIKKPDFNRSFIATHEFEARIQVLHKVPNGEVLLRMYIDHLDKNLWEVDAMAAAVATGDTKLKFESFATQRLTRIEDGAIYADRLSDYYGQKRSEISAYRKKLAAHLSQKNVQELNVLKKQLRDYDKKNNIFTAAPPVNPATSAVYATNWFTMGWGNIDLYLKLLDGKTRSVEIIVDKRSERIEVSQWLAAANTYANLAENDGTYRAVFPNKKGRFVDTWVFALSGSAPEFEWAFQQYDPYKVESVSLAITSVTESDIRRDLRQVGEQFGRIQKARAEQRQAAERMISAQMASQERAAALMAERQTILNSIASVQREQQAIQFMMGKLKEVGYPCGIQSVECEGSNRTLVEAIQIFTIVEMMPEFMGGQRSLNEYIQRNLKYPSSAVTAEIEGVVFVTFVVQPDGQVTDAKVLRGIDPACDAAALEMVNSMPRWNAGRQRDREVAVQYNLPVTFSLK